MTDSLGERIKRYEAAYNQTLTPRMPVIIRVDGRAFHTYTKGMNRPFDRKLMGAMVLAARQTSGEMQGFRLAYVQSDECTFLLTDTAQLNTQGWFGYELNKIVSLSASIFTAHFNWYMDGDVATFDARAFNVPEDDVPNVFIWRAADWQRNSLQMLARAHFSHKELIGKGRQDMHDMLHAKGINWADLLPEEKNGTFITRDQQICERADYEQIRRWIDGETDGDARLEFQREEYAGFRDSQGNWRSGRQPRPASENAFEFLVDREEGR